MTRPSLEGYTRAVWARDDGAVGPKRFVVFPE